MPRVYPPQPRQRIRLRRERNRVANHPGEEKANHREHGVRGGTEEKGKGGVGSTRRPHRRQSRTVAGTARSTLLYRSWRGAV